MAKRPLGLGKKAQNKKQKTEETSEASPAPNQIHIELDENVDPENELSQLQGLWTTHLKSEKESDSLLNGIVHECDSLLRNGASLSDEYYAIYAMALAELASFHAEEAKDYFEAALERVSDGLEKYPASNVLKLAEARILLQRIPLEYISALDIASDKCVVDLAELLEKATSSYSNVGQHLLQHDILGSFDDLLDIVENFGHQDIGDGLDSDDEDEFQGVELAEDHPLYKVRKGLDKHYKWLEAKHAELLHSMDSEKAIELYRKVANKLGQLYLRSSEEPSMVFTAINYDSDVEDEEIDGMDAQTAQKLAIESISKAVECFEKAEDKEDPQTWVDIAEAKIQLANVHDNESAEQEKIYKEAEELLIKANKATGGKYEVILDNLKA